jgi:tryptophan synthase alpha chain
MIRRTFDRLRERDEMALVPYLVAGYPTLDESLSQLQRIAASGADLVELGVPFSDPIADGPTIQQAAVRALQGGARLSRILQGIDRLRLPVPVILMSYLNPLLAHGRDEVLADMEAVGVSGLIVPDLPLEEATPWRESARRHGIDLVLLIAPTTSDERAREIAARSDGFVYYVSVTGTTGARESLSPQLLPSLSRLRERIDTPLAVGFGISEPEQVRSLRGRADGAVVGSRIVEAIRQGEDVADLVNRLKQATVHKEHEPCWSS